MSNQNVVSARVGASPVPELSRPHSPKVLEPGQPGASPGQESAAEIYQQKLTDIGAKDWQSKNILCIEGWPVHRDDVHFVEESMIDIISDFVSRIKCEYAIIVGTTPVKPRFEANRWLLKLREDAIKENHPGKISVRLI